MSNTCPECGGELAPGGTCDQLLWQIGTWEQSEPGVKDTAHHLLVLAWQAQHPKRFSDKSLAWACEGIRRALSENLTGEQLREISISTPLEEGRTWKIMGGGGQTILRQWPMTLSDVVERGPNALPDSIMRWAESVLAELES